MLSCMHCRASAQWASGPDELTTAEGMAFLDHLADFGKPSPVLVMTGGDCLMRDDIIPLAAHARELGLHVAISPSVTGRLEAGTLGALRDAGIKTASVSLDGASPGTHDAVRGVPGHLSATLLAIELLHSCGFTVQVNTTVMRKNLAEMAEVFALISGLGVAIWEVFFLINTGRGTAVEALGAAENEAVCHFLVDAARYGMIVRTVEAPFYRRVLTERRAQELDAPPSHLEDGGLYRRLHQELVTCMGAPSRPVPGSGVSTRDGNGVIFVGNNGDIYPSGLLPLRLGNIREASLVSTYRDNSLLQDIRSSRFSGACGTCPYSGLCGGSRARAYAATGDPLGEDPGCVLAGSRSLAVPAPLAVR